MSLRGQLEVVESNIDVLEDSIRKIQKQEEELLRQRMDLRVQIIREEKLLAVNSWKYQVCLRNKSTFKLLARGGRYQYEALVDLLMPDHHDHYSLINETRTRTIGGANREYECHIVELNFYDDDVQLMFDNDQAAMEFIKEFGITVDYSGIKKDRDEVAAQLKSLDEIVKVLEENHGQSTNDHQK